MKKEYTYQNLMEGEEVVAKGELNKISLITMWIFSVITFFLIFPIIHAIVTTKQYKNSGIILTNKRVIGTTKQGLRSGELAIPLDKVQTVTTGQEAVGQILKYGAVTVGTSSGIIKFTAIKNPGTFKLALMNQIEKYQQEKAIYQANLIAEAIKGYGEY